MDFGNSSQRKFQCFICGTLHDDYPQMKEHIMKDHEEGREWIRCPLAHCSCPVRDMRVHFKAKHPSMTIPKNCQLRASIWYDQTGKSRKKKFSFAEGNYVSKKNGGESMHYRSGWELQIYKLLEEMGEINSYRVEPFSITYYFNGKARTYIPDLLINFVDGRQELWECKPANQLGVPQIKAKKAAAEEYCLARGLVYKMITEGVIDRMKQDVKNRKLMD